MRPTARSRGASSSPGRKEGGRFTTPSSVFENRQRHDGRTLLSGEVGHFELPADNTERARKFYSTTFGWKMNPMPGMDYTMVNTGAIDAQGTPKEPGYISGGIGQRGGALEHPVVTIVVEDVAAAAKKVEKNGSKIVQPKQEIPGNMGWTAYFKDTEDNVVGLYQWPTRPDG